MASERRTIRWRYKVIFAIEGGPEGGLVALDENRLDDAVGMGRRIAGDDWWEVVDRFTGNVVASSRTHGKKD